MSELISRQAAIDAINNIRQNLIRETLMSLEKAIEHGKEKRKPYHGAKAVDKSCRNHGGDPWDEANRLVQARREADRMKAREDDYGRSDGG